MAELHVGVSNGVGSDGSSLALLPDVVEEVPNAAANEDAIGGTGLLQGLTVEPGTEEELVACPLEEPCCALEGREFSRELGLLQLEGTAPA